MLRTLFAGAQVPAECALNRRLGYDFCAEGFEPKVLIFEDTFNEPSASAEWHEIHNGLNTADCGAMTDAGTGAWDGPQDFSEQEGPGALRALVMSSSMYYESRHRYVITPPLGSGRTWRL